MRRALGIVGMVLAVLGVLLCLVLLIGGWYGRSVVNAAVRDMLPNADSALGQGSDFLNRAEVLLDKANGEIGGARTRLRNTVDNSAEGVAAVTGAVRNVVNSIVEPVRYVRSQLAALRGSITLFATFFNGLPSFMNLPEIPTDRLEAMDESARAIDERIAEIEDSVNTTQENIAETRAAIVATLDEVQGSIENLSSTAATVSTALAALRNALPAIQSRINLYATFAAILLTLLAFCGAALFVNLFNDAWHEWEIGGHKWIKSHTTSTTTETSTRTQEGAEVVTTTITVTESKAKRLAEEGPVAR